MGASQGKVEQGTPGPQTGGSSGMDHGGATIQRRTGSVSPIHLQRLQRSAGNAAVARHFQSGHGPTRPPSGEGAVTVQRVNYGNDPSVGIANADEDLLYGLTFVRGKTQTRMRNAGQRTQLRTIDEYNKAIGINLQLMGNNTAAMGLFDVRAQLNSAAAWNLPVAPADAHLANANTALWANYLRAHAAYIGLVDLGVNAGWFKTDKISKKDRFTKNLKSPQTGAKKADKLTASDVRDFLGSSTRLKAQNRYNAMSAAKKQALNGWVQMAFFRRTSKLGQKFAINVLHAKIWFNTRADPDWDPILRTSPIGGRGEIDRGVDVMSQTGNNANLRSITVSELRQMRKLQALHPGSFEEYGE